MKLKKTNAELAKVRKEIKQIKKDISEVIKEHESLVFKGTAQEAAIAFDKFPIMTLNESLLVEKKRPSPTFMSRIKRKTQLIREYKKLNQQLDSLADRERSIKIDLTLQNLKDLQDGLDSD